VFIKKNVLFPLDVSGIKGYGQKHSKYNQGEKHVFIKKNVLFPLDVSRIKGYGQKHSKYNQGEKWKNFSQSWQQSKH
jgi:hypothetical protein